MPENYSPPSALEFFKALADETRMLSLLLIERAGELCVCELMAALEMPQPKISRHLAQLRKCGIVSDRREGQWVYYRLHPGLLDWMKSTLSDARRHSQGKIETPMQRLQTINRRSPFQSCASTEMLQTTGSCS
ncbi:metalloregulator ArsR/SmtB family transcription factor [Pseudohongiella sp. SYSU M77423]|uniref:ArsR/SmtB family transcription factor n=1 Tax=unclassified Pseudohongiella TaxID=2629611 RepID=UPI000C5107E4|nr:MULTISPECIES: metalloregulator ArsR/SmtB family transcription factor [unclassified Pseudohongiella]MAY56561.1 transcriptional regulator [Gammaproteobacteria bacterium]MBJ54911.1 transcriptional regulator [Gammaproteobacteria bacterium]MDH7945033.1 metalloregulator ArsR/SmtB family transcription factor [Pseudohongiella sp. SYSU M77423]|tara:strand:- start:428 stop:826 length:399 start_codon:yes stop_codon:yes gene_type:complete